MRSKLLLLFILLSFVVVVVLIIAAAAFAAVDENKALNAVLSTDFNPVLRVSQRNQKELSFV